eukprot:4112547-Pleurochrysis_carterae.AAC.2
MHQIDIENSSLAKNTIKSSRRTSSKQGLASSRRLQMYCHLLSCPGVRFYPIESLKHHRSLREAEWRRVQ